MPLQGGLVCLPAKSKVHEEDTEPGLMRPECVGIFWMRKALIPLTGPAN